MSESVSYMALHEGKVKTQYQFSLVCVSEGKSAKNVIFIIKHTQIYLTM